MCLAVIMILKKVKQGLPTSGTNLWIFLCAPSIIAGASNNNIKLTKISFRKNLKKLSPSLPLHRAAAIVHLLPLCIQRSVVMPRITVSPSVFISLIRKLLWNCFCMHYWYSCRTVWFIRTTCCWVQDNLQCHESSIYWIIWKVNNK